MDKNVCLQTNMMLFANTNIYTNFILHEGTRVRKVSNYYCKKSYTFNCRINVVFRKQNILHCKRIFLEEMGRDIFQTFIRCIKIDDDFTFVSKYFTG